MEAPVRALLSAAALFFLASPAGATTLTVVSDESHIWGGCSRLRGEYGTDQYDGYRFNLTNPNPGQSWVVAGSIPICGLDYSFALTIDQDSITIERKIVDHWNPDEENQAQGFMRDFGGYYRLAVESDTPVRFWDGLSLDPYCEAAPCEPMTTLVTSFYIDFAVGWIPRGRLWGDQSLRPISTTTRYWAAPYTIPEPGTAVLLALGLASGAVRRRSQGRVVPRVRIASA